MGWGWSLSSWRQHAGVACLDGLTPVRTLGNKAQEPATLYIVPQERTPGSLSLASLGICVVCLSLCPMTSTYWLHSTKLLIIINSSSILKVIELNGATGTPKSHPGLFYPFGGLIYIHTRMMSILPQYLVVGKFKVYLLVYICL